MCPVGTGWKLEPPLAPQSTNHESMAEDVCCFLPRLGFTLLVVLLFSCVAGHEAAEELEVVTDNDLLGLIQKESYVVVLFTKKKCKECDDLEQELVAIRGDLVDILGAWVVKAVKSSLVKNYSPEEEPAVVFFRHGSAMLYEGPANEDSLNEELLRGREPAVKELSDDSFEHLTQASTGATTGAWLVMFYSPECVACNRLRARWEYIGSQLAGRINVAMVNAKGPGVSTGRRFSVNKYPSVIMFNLGRLYRYTIEKYDSASLISFATGWYKNMPAEMIPAPKSPFDNILDATVELLQENTVSLKIGGATVFVACILLFFFCKKSGQSDLRKKK